jgi:biopolymer transport protein ExbD
MVLIGKATPEETSAIFSGEEGGLMALGSRTGGTFSEINVTPLTDVFLVLLVIMIIVAPLTTSTVLKVSAPQVPGALTINPDDLEEKQVSVLVSADGAVSVNGASVQPVTTETIQEKIKAEQAKAGTQDIVVNLSSDEKARHKNVVAVMDAAAGAQVKQLRIVSLRH